MTGFYSVDENLQDVNRQSLFIDRIYERGEALAVVRSLTSVLVQPSEVQPTICGVRYSLFYPADLWRGTL
ncbi:MAG: putative lipoprotein transrane [Variovorax sp.]|nr:putative lipoprotein transrane [Variovorax sp.]